MKRMALRLDKIYINISIDVTTRYCMSGISKQTRIHTRAQRTTTETRFICERDKNRFIKATNKRQVICQSLLCVCVCVRRKESTVVATAVLLFCLYRCVVIVGDWPPQLRRSIVDFVIGFWLSWDVLLCLFSSLSSSLSLSWSSSSSSVAVLTFAGH